MPGLAACGYHGVPEGAKLVVDLKLVTKVLEQLKSWLGHELKLQVTISTSR